ncbi:type VI secretion system lipoprotein TssJ [Desulfoluna sp.]|uniref:type VI secretion system lipoprotein TssJ n=1 Tax=Desulfoluna sp. TaxID=2045199 RepID=UPI00261BA885|nr:type VI secretion system lipoprotein TssJ [Desulfoluna sp.]
MKKVVLGVMVFLIVTISACGLSPVSPPDWKLQKEGIILHFDADNQLNQSHGKAYTLYLVLYQLSDPNSFNQLCEDQDGLSTLLEGKVYDESVASVKSVYIYPGSDVTHKLERAEGARYLGIVAGYGVLAKERIVRLVEVPVYIERTRTFSMNKKLVPGQLRCDFVLGPDQIEDVKDI